MTRVEIVYLDGKREEITAKQLQWLLGIKDKRNHIFTYRYL